MEPASCSEPTTDPAWLVAKRGIGQGGKMIESVQVESVSVPVSDQEQAKEFYVDTLGFELPP
jgi:catechol-2,3-dioxygenase